MLVRGTRDVFVANEGAVCAADVERDGRTLGMRIAEARAGIVVDTADGPTISAVAERDELVVQDPDEIRGVGRDELHRAVQLRVHI